MNTQIIELEARQLLKKEGRRSRARALLDRRASITMTTLVSSIATGIALFCMADFTAPLAVKVMITLSFSSAIVSQVESWQSRRRLEAAIELLRQSDSGRGWAPKQDRDLWHAEKAVASTR